mgnify:FL=1
MALTSDVKAIGIIGDVTPIEYGGGYVFKGDDGIWIEYTNGLGDFDGDESALESYRVEVYRVKVADDVFFDLDWMNWDNLAFSMGRKVKELESESLSDNPVTRAMLYWDVASHYGWHELDHYPLILTVKELEDRWAGAYEEAKVAIRAGHV